MANSHNNKLLPSVDETMDAFNTDAYIGEFGGEGIRTNYPPMKGPDILSPRLRGRSINHSPAGIPEAPASKLSEGLDRDLHCPDCDRDFSDSRNDPDIEVGASCPSDDCPSHDASPSSHKESRLREKDWSGSPDPCDPDNYWIDDKTGERVHAVTNERTAHTCPKDAQPAKKESRAAFAQLVGAVGKTEASGPMIHRDAGWERKKCPSKGPNPNWCNKAHPEDCNGGRPGAPCECSCHPLNRGKKESVMVNDLFEGDLAWLR